MYSFTRKTLGPYTVHISVQKSGDTHHKKFTGTVSPSTQSTTNIYVKGNFLFTIGNYSQEMVSGQTSLDLNIDEYPVDTLATETVLSDYAVRYCVPSKGLTKQVVEIPENQTYSVDKNSLVFVLSGKAFVNNTQVGLGGYWLVQNTCSITGPVKLLILSNTSL